MKEIDIQRNYLEKETVQTVYFGGGTPSMLSHPELQSILTKISDSFDVSADAELTLEANPDDISEEILEGWQKAGINRVSLGIQSFFKEDLEWMNRAHTAQQSMKGLQLVTRYFENVTIDLIYGSPALTNEKWKQNVEQILAFNIPHISCYALTVETGTPLQKMIRLGKTENVSQDKQSDQFILLMQWLQESGYEHYEISNFAKPGFRSRHNSSYWQGKKYLGLGPSAHSFDGISRQWNVSNNNIYIESLKKDILPFEKEILTVNQQLNEYIMTSLRTMEGLNLHFVEKKFGKEAGEKLISGSRRHILNNKMIKTENNYLLLTREGKLLADGLASDLFVI